MMQLSILVVLKHFVHDVSAFFIKGKSAFINGPRNLPRNPPDCITLEICVLDNFKFPDELFAKGLPRLET